MEVENQILFRWTPKAESPRRIKTEKYTNVPPLFRDHETGVDRVMTAGATRCGGNYRENAGEGNYSLETPAHIDGKPTPIPPLSLIHI